MKISKHKTLFILDWDDTLFPTNWVMKNGINLLTSSRDQYVIYFQELDRVLSKFLKNVINMGKVIIVTNALPDWINISSVVLPHTYNLLRKVKIISARGIYRNVSSKMMDWKMMAFRDIIDKEFNNASLMNVISVGDAEYEYQALISISKQKVNTTKYLKSIRFMKDPSHDILIDQLEVLNEAIPKIWTQDKHLDLKFDHFSNINKTKKKKSCDDVQ
jgi:hypothetical protein